MPSQARALQSVVQGKLPCIVDGVDTLRMPVGLELGIHTRTSRGQSASSRISNVVYRQQCFHDLSIEFRHCLTKSRSFQEHEVTCGHYTLRAQRLLKWNTAVSAPVCVLHWVKVYAQSCRKLQGLASAVKISPQVPPGYPSSGLIVPLTED